MTILQGDLVTLRPAGPGDIDALGAVRSAPEIRERWDSEPGEDVVAAVGESIADPDLKVLVIELGGRVVGSIQWSAEPDPMYRHANMDLFVDPAEHGHGVGTDAVRTLARHLIDDHGHHRIVIDPAADNVAAIRCYARAGFRSVGVMRRYERGPDGTWHDGLLMDLLADELAD